MISYMLKEATIADNYNNGNNGNSNNYNNKNNNKNKYVCCTNSTKTKMTMIIRVSKRTTAPQPNSILQFLERCELGIGVGQRAAD